MKLFNNHSGLRGLPRFAEGVLLGDRFIPDDPLHGWVPGS